MKKLLWLFVLAFPMAAQADYFDVIGGKLNPACSVEKYLQIVQDFRVQWADARGYKVEILFPTHSEDLATFFWVGRISNAESFGKGLDAWMSAQSDPTTAPAKLMARFRECTTNQSRTGYISR